MALFIGMDLGGTNLKYGVGNEKGEIFLKKIKPSLAQESADEIFENIYSAIEELITETGKEINGIGFGTPGIVNFESGQVLGNTPNLKDWSNAPIKQKLQEKFNLPTWVDNDANLMTLAEARIGAAKEFSYVVCLTIGTGIGGGIILDNHLYRGINYAAAEIGHITINIHGKPCNCGKLGCLEAYASAPAMIERYRHKLKRTGLLFKEEQLTTEFIFHKASVHEDLAIQTIDETSEYLGAGIVSVVNILNPQAVVIGGGVADAGEVFINKIESVVVKNSMKINSEPLKIKKAKLGNDAGIVGAILLAAENLS